jgi:hypothetical protein
MLLGTFYNGRILAHIGFGGVHYVLVPVIFPGKQCTSGTL